MNNRTIIAADAATVEGPSWCSWPSAWCVVDVRGPGDRPGHDGRGPHAVPGRGRRRGDGRHPHAQRHRRAITTSNASPNAIAAATANTVLVDAGRLEPGRPCRSAAIRYVPANQRFEGQFPGPSTDNWSMVQATVTANVSSQLAFRKSSTSPASNIQATATAVHRPRDIAIILDYSGSMRFASLTGDPY